MNRTYWTFGSAAVVSALGLALVATASAAKPGDDTGVERARREVKLLDDVYKTAVVLITEHYVKDETNLAAATAAKALFAEINKKGWHEARIIDATTKPYNEENVAKSDFEKQAVKDLLAGKGSVDKVVTENGKRYLLAATPVPVVMKKCVMCHEHYKDTPKDQAVGALTYKIPIQE